MAKQPRPRTVYVIDDSGSVHIALARCLGSANSKMETFASADEFLEKPKQTKDAAPKSVVNHTRRKGLH